MSNGSLRSLLVVLVLGAAAVLVLVARPLGLLPDGPAGHAYIADLDYWQRTPRERLVRSNYPLDLDHELSDVPLALGEWTGREVPPDNVGVYMVLEPEQFVQRLYYHSDGRYLWLTLIGGRSSRTFHPPESCYESYGWQTQIASHPMELANGDQLYGMLVDANKADEHQLSYYLYLFPRQGRSPGDGMVIFRVTTPLYGTTEETLALQQDFVREFFISAEERGS